MNGYHKYNLSFLENSINHAKSVRYVKMNRLYYFRVKHHLMKTSIQVFWQSNESFLRIYKNDSDIGAQ
jgi:hypothetical protein